MLKKKDFHGGLAWSKINELEKCNVEIFSKNLTVNLMQNLRPTAAHKPLVAEFYRLLTLLVSDP